MYRLRHDPIKSESGELCLTKPGGTARGESVCLVQEFIALLKPEQERSAVLHPALACWLIGEDCSSPCVRQHGSSHTLP